MKRSVVVKAILLIVLLLCVLGVAACKKETPTLTYQVYFYADGVLKGTADTMGNSVVTLPASPEKEGYVFKGWFTDKLTFEDEFTADYLTKHPISANLSVYAKFNSLADEAKFADGYGETKLSLKEMESYAQSNLFTIEAKDFYGNTNVGGGVFINKEGLGATAYSVLKNAKEATITLYSGKVYNITEITYADEESGIAVFKTDAAKTTTAHIGDVGDIENESTIYFFGLESGEMLCEEGSVIKASAIIGEQEFVQVNLRGTYQTGGIITDQCGDVVGIKADDITIFDAEYKNVFVPIVTLAKAEQSEGEALYDYMRKQVNLRVGFNSNGEIVETQECYFGDEITPPIVEKTGYEFYGWWNLDYTEEYDFNTNVATESADYYAKWSAIHYAISYDLDGGANSINNPEYYTIDSLDVILEDPIKENYDFVRWETSGKKFEKIATGSQGDVNVLAVWVPTTYDLVYELDGGITVQDNPTAYNIESENITLLAPIKVGYVFTGWSGTEISTTSKSVTVYSGSSGDRTYTAGWELCDAHNFVNCICTKCGAADDHDVDSNCVCKNCGKTVHAANTYCRHESSVYYGNYPQTQENSENITSILNKLAGTLPTSVKPGAWISYGYYVFGSANTAYIWYQDVEYLGEKYRGVYFTGYRPYLNTYGGSAENSYQDDNGYECEKTYWFKFEPIKWSIIEESEGKATIVADLVLDSREFRNAYNEKDEHFYAGSSLSIYANDYANSNIYSWLNGTFYQTALSDAQKAIALETDVENGAASTNPNYNANEWYFGVNNNICNDTKDRVWLLSVQDVTNGTYGYAENVVSATSRQKAASAYAKCQGVYENAGFANMLLRSPDYLYENKAYIVKHDGSIETAFVNDSSNGIVPAMRITL